MGQMLSKNGAGRSVNPISQDAARRARVLESEQAAAENWKPGRAIILEPIFEVWLQCANVCASTEDTPLGWEYSVE